MGMMGRMSMGVWRGGGGLVPMPPIDPLAFYDLSSPTYMTLDGSNNVTGVTDRSGNDHHIITTTDSPRFLPAVDHLLGAVDFGVNQGYMTIPASVSIGRSTSTIVAISRKTRGENFQSGQTMVTINSGALLPMVARNSNVWELFTGSAFRPATVVGPIDNTTVNYAILGSSAVTLGVDDAFETVAAMSAATVTGGFIGRHSAATYQYDGELVAVLIFNTALTALQMDSIRAYAATYFGAPTPGKCAVVMSGDSITAGIGATGNGIANNEFYSWPAQMFASYPGTARPQVANRGVPSDFIDTTAASMIAALDRTALGSRPRVAIFSWGANDFAFNETAAGAIADMNTAMAAVRAAHSDVKIGISTVTNATRFSEAQLAERDTYHAEVRSPTVDGLTHDFHIDMQAIGVLSDPTNTTYYADNLHPTALGYTAMAATAKAATDAYLATL
jgi:lysophospholipase L1-like esterase